MGRIWSEENKIRTWLEVELRALEALARYRHIPKGIPAKVRARARFSVKRIREIESKVQHDVIAFLTNLAEHAGPAGRYVHYGLTSSDILDTALALQLKEASRILIGELKRLIAVLGAKAKKHQNTLMAGRTHGVFAEPTTFGFKMALFYAEFKRGLARFVQAAKEVEVGKLSGAVGTFANVDPKVEAYVCRKLALTPAPISTQIIQRDRHAAYLATIAIIGGSLEKLATEIRHLQKSEVREVEEFFAEGQKGSSAMPHKRNPITCERVAGLARILRGNSVAAMENISLWHERDITHSSVERVIFPDSTILLDYMLSTMSGVIQKLRVYPDSMEENLKRSRGMVFSQGLLLKLIQKGLTREKAYELIQEAAKRVWEDGRIDLRRSVLDDRKIAKVLTPREIESVFDYGYHTKNVKQVFKRLRIRG